MQVQPVRLRCPQSLMDPPYRTRRNLGFFQHLQPGRAVPLAEGRSKGAEQGFFVLMPTAQSGPVRVHGPAQNLA